VTYKNIYIVQPSWSYQSYLIKISHFLHWTYPTASLESASTTKQKYLHTVDFPFISSVLNSPDVSFFLTSSMMPVCHLLSCCHSYDINKFPPQKEGCYPKFIIRLFTMFKR